MISVRKPTYGFKLGVAMACVAGLLTMTLSLVNGVRLMTAVSRSVISALLFLVLGFVVWVVMEKKINLDQLKGQKIDVSSQAQPGDLELIAFKPLEMENLERLSDVEK